MHKPFSFIVVMFLWVVAAAHAARLVFHISVTIGHVQIPLWLSIFPAIILPAIAIMLRKEAKTGR